MKSSNWTEEGDPRPSQFRAWVPLQAAHKKGADHTPSFTVLTYNTLADSYSRSQAAHCDPAYLRWSYRRPAILRELLHYSPDIGCLQEVDRVMAIRRPLESAGYSVIVRSRPMRPDACVLFYRNARFSLELTEQIDYDCVASDRSAVATFAGGNTRALLTGNVGVMAVLVDRESVDAVPPSLAQIASSASVVGDGRVLVVTAHFHWLYPEIKLAQAAYTMRRVQRAIVKHRVSKVVFCGDLNSLPESAVYQWLSTGAVDEAHPERAAFPCFMERNLTQLQSAYAELGEPITNFTRRFCGCLDYVWHSPGLAPSEALEPFEQSGRFLPDCEQPSDHVPLCVRLHYCRQ
eukprot:m51a1_g3262 putative potential mrna deadenylase and ccr4-not complex subunit ccr4p (347) ;mRNA; r:195950-197128